MWIFVLPALATSDGTPETCNGIDDDANGRVDDGAVCTGCQQLGYDGRSYLVCAAEVADRPAAAALCDGFGYHLVDVQSEAEHTWLTGELDLLVTYWTGLSDSEPNSYRWSDGSDAGYIPWGPAQPDDLTGTEGCAWYFAPSGAQQHGLNDVPCTADGAGVICESEPSTFEECDTAVPPPPEDTGSGVVVGPPPAGHVICACQTGSKGAWVALMLSALALLVRRPRPQPLRRS